MPFFCEHCGNLIEDGEICNCNTEENKSSSFENIEPDELIEFTNEVPLPQEEDVSENTKIECEDNLSLFKAITSFFKSPYTFTLKGYKSFSFYNSMCLVCIGAITAGICALIFISLLVTKHSTFLYTIDRILGLGGMLSLFHAPIVILKKEIFIKVFVLVYLLFFILAGLFYICGKLFGSEEGRFKHVICFLSITSLSLSFAFVISSFALLLIPPLVPYIFAYIFLVTIIINNAALNDVFNISPNKSVFSTSLAYIAFFFIINILTIETLRTAVNYFHSFH